MAYNERLTYQVTGNTAGVMADIITGTVVFAGGDNITLSQNGNSVTISGAAGGAGGNINISAGTTSNNLTAFTFDNANGVSFGLNASTVTASHNGLTSQSNQNITAANGGFAFQTLSFSNLNGISFGTSAGSAITASHNALTSQSNQAWSGSNASSTFQTLSFNNANGVSWSNNAGAVQASYTRNVASNAIQAVGSATGSGTNTSRFAADDHVHAGVFSMGVSTAGNTIGDTRVSVGQFVFQGGNNITLSQITGANQANTIVFSGAAGGGETRITAYAQSNTTQSSTGTIALSSINFAGAGIASVGISNGSVVVSVPAGGGAGDGGVFAGVSNLGNTAGSTGTVSTGNLVFVGSNGISLSQSTGGAGSAATITINGVAPYTFSGLNPYDNQHSITGGLGAGSILIDPITLPNVQFDRILVPIQASNATNSSGSHTLSVYIGLYTQNNSTLSLLQSYSTSTNISMSGTVGSYSLFSGFRNLSMGATTTFTEGKYWLAFMSQSSSSLSNATYNHFLISQMASSYVGIFGQSNNTTQQFELGRGIYNTSSSVMPNSLAFSGIQGNGTLSPRGVAIHFASGTI